MARHPLYKVRIELADKNAVLQEVKEYRIGLRTLTVSQDKDQWGSEFAFKINVFKIFTKGADYIPEDCIYSHITKERLEMLDGYIGKIQFPTACAYGAAVIIRQMNFMIFVMKMV